MELHAANLGEDISTGTGGVRGGHHRRVLQGTDGDLWHALSTDYGANWLAANLGMGGIGQPLAAAETSGAVDVFWKGTNDAHIWHAW